MTTIEKPRSAEQIKERAYGVPTDLTSKTGYCSSYNHKRCPYRQGGACENGIALSDGGFYMCPCDCHAEQAAPVKLKKARLAKPHTEPEWSGLKGTDSPNYSGPVEKVAVIEQQIEKPAKAKKAAPAKSPKAPKAAKPSAEPTKLGNAEKQAVRYEIAALLRGHFDLANFPALDGTNLDGIAPELIVAYIEDHWLQYIDPDKDKARREAAAAARKGK